ncbi:MAG: hypothetical protein ACLFWI_17940 [Coleofasciculus sp.]|uniref:hypothetical protein n=1 Tax=Coleofasciculus sp. TaxID=3100458 RepID=UPI003A4987C2
MTGANEHSCLSPLQWWCIAKERWRNPLLILGYAIAPLVMDEPPLTIVHYASGCFATPPYKRDRTYSSTPSKRDHTSPLNPIQRAIAFGTRR